MDVGQWVNRLESEFYVWGGFNAVPWNIRDYKPIIEHVQGMSTPSNMHLLNLAVQCLGENECYLEVGTWRGRTLIGALLNNEAHGIAIDDDSMDTHDGDERLSEDVWRENVARFEMTERTQYVNGSVPAVWEGMQLEYPAGVYLFDGDKSTPEAAYIGIESALPFLAGEALIFVDDANELNITLACTRLERNYPQHIARIMWLPTPGNTWPMWWNGVIALLWRA